MNRRYSIAIVLLIFSVSCLCQSIKPLQIGQEVPDVVFNEVLNYGKKQIKLSDFKGKTVILDFWNIHCPVCIKQFPRLKKIQDSLGEEVMILPVGFDLKERGSIRSFVEARRGKPTELLLPTVVQKPEDTLLLYLFTPRAMPHEVWIDKDGIFRGSTGHKNVTGKNIVDFNKGLITWHPKKEWYIYPTDEFLIQKSKPHTFGSVITGYNDTLGRSAWNTLQAQHDSSVIRFFYTNHTLFSMYKDVYSKFNKEIEEVVYNKRILVDNARDSFYQDAVDPGAMDNWEEEAFKRRNTFCYELVLPNTYTLQQAYRFMIQDLDRYFNVKSKLEKRKVECLQLVRTSTGNKMAATKGKIAREEWDKAVKLTNYPMEDLIQYLNASFTKLIIVNNTGYEGGVDLVLANVQKNDLVAYNKALEKYDLRLESVQKEFEFLVLEDLAGK